MLTPFLIVWTPLSDKWTGWSCDPCFSFPSTPQVHTDWTASEIPLCMTVCVAAAFLESERGELITESVSLKMFKEVHCQGRNKIMLFVALSLHGNSVTVYVLCSSKNLSIMQKNHSAALAWPHPAKHSKYTVMFMRCSRRSFGFAAVLKMNDSPEVCPQTAVILSCLVRQVRMRVYVVHVGALLCDSAL